MPKVTSPHWLAEETGRYFETSASATGFSIDSGIWLFGKVAPGPPLGFFSTTALPLDWHAAEAIVLKSPFSIEAVVRYHLKTKFSQPLAGASNIIAP
jgi:hypothetical protein